MFQILIYFLSDNCYPPLKKVTPPSQQPPLKVEILSSALFRKFRWRLNPPHLSAHYGDDKVDEESE